jgi:hypothetical protein
VCRLIYDAFGLELNPDDIPDDPDDYKYEHRYPNELPEQTIRDIYKSALYNRGIFAGGGIVVEADNG